MITITPRKARFRIKKDYIVLEKTGFLLLDFTPLLKIENEIIPLWKEKESFLLNPEKANILGQHEIDSEKNLKEKFIYNNKSKEFNFNKIEDSNLKRFFFYYKFVNLDNNVEFKGILREIEFVMIQRMINYCFPFMMGWHVLDSNKIANEDMIKF